LPTKYNCSNEGCLEKKIVAAMKAAQRKKIIVEAGSSRSRALIPS